MIKCGFKVTVCLDFQVKAIIFAKVGLKEASLLRFPV